MQRIEWPICLPTGFLPNEIDHANRIKTDNRICNLREATRAENSRNKSISIKNTVGLKGVSKYEGRANPYRSWIKVDYRSIYLGSFKTAEEAHQAYAAAAKKYHVDFACLQ